MFTQQALTLEPITMFVNSFKFTSDLGTIIQFAIHSQEAWEVLSSPKILNLEQLNCID
jgi:hypothetical protein